MSFGGGGGGHALREAQGFDEDYLNYLKQIFAPYEKAGTIALPQLQSLLSDAGHADFLKNYFKSDQYKAQDQAAENNQLAAAEATGGLGSSGNANALAAIAPQLGAQAFQQKLGGLAGLAGLGSGATANFAQAGGGVVSNLNNIFSERAQLENAQSGGLFGGLGSILGLLGGQGGGLGGLFSGIGSLI